MVVLDWVAEGGGGGGEGVGVGGALCVGGS